MGKEERNEVIPVGGDRTLCIVKSHFITAANATCFGHHFESGKLNHRSIFSGGKEI